MVIRSTIPCSLDASPGRGVVVTRRGHLKSSLFDDALLGVRKPSDAEITRRAREAAARMLSLLEAGRL